MLNCLEGGSQVVNEQSEPGLVVGGLDFAWRDDWPTAIDLANQCYIVLRAPGHQVPLLALRAGDYRHVVGDFTSDTISHGFPSQAEARAYCLGAGVEFPWSSRP